MLDVGLQVVEQSDFGIDGCGGFFQCRKEGSRLFLHGSGGVIAVGEGSDNASVNRLGVGDALSLPGTSLVLIFPLLGAT